MTTNIQKSQQKDFVWGTSFDVYLRVKRATSLEGGGAATPENWIGKGDWNVLKDATTEKCFLLIGRNCN